MVKHAKAMRGMIRNPMTRTDHPNPREDPFSIFDKAIGITMPPMEDPETTTPKAAARLFLKCWETAANAGNCRSPMARPIRTPCASMACQYRLHRLSIIIAKTYVTAVGRITY